MLPGDTIAPGLEPSELPASGGGHHKSHAKEPKNDKKTMKNTKSADDAGWDYEPNDKQADVSITHRGVLPSPTVTWTASEYVAHDKGGGWFAMVMLADIVLVAIVYLITREMVSSIVVGTVVLLFAVFGIRPPHVLEYSVDGHGVHIGQKSYLYGLFQSFSVLEDNALHSILLMPVKRLALPITIYYDPADEEKIVNVIGGHIPHENREVPPLDRMMSKIRF